MFSQIMILSKFSRFAPCNHEEADTRIFVHAKNMAETGHRKIMIKTVDAVVIIIAIAVSHELHLKELWIEFRTGKTDVGFQFTNMRAVLESRSVLGFCFGMHLQDVI